MKKALFLFLAATVIIAASSCSPNRGCTETTADNFDVNAKQDDGTCIPGRDKLIGSYRYTKLWIDVITEVEMVDAGTIQITEANTADNAFNMNLNGSLIFQGSVSAYDIVMEQTSLQDTFFGQYFTRSYNGTGEWLLSDTVDMTFNMNTQIPMWNGANPPAIVTVPQIYYYYCTKTQ
ncbi:MAG: hypothetical protein K9J17_17005 [Flavobacteriales bacterium]|nr:hypothetical protein [Flavobacteriales bacterium]